MSLPSPLTASDEWVRPRDTTVEVIRVTAGLHRQVWVSGTSIYVDVHVANNSRKAIKRIELQLERDILCYKHVCLMQTIFKYLAKLTEYCCRLLHQLWKSPQARLESLTATSVLFLAKQRSSKGLLAGMVFLLTKRISGLATWSCRAVSLP
jgi:hypothetical protein